MKPTLMITLLKHRGPVRGAPCHQAQMLQGTTSKSRPAGQPQISYMKTPCDPSLTPGWNLV